MRLQSSFFLTLLALVLSFGTQSCSAPEVSLTPLMAAMRMDPPAEGKNKVWIEYQDLTAQGSGFEDGIYEGLQDAIVDRGYVSVGLPDEADYVLWATTRLLDPVENESKINEKVAALGAIAGAVGGGIAGNAVGGGTGAVIGAVGGAGAVGWAAGKLTQTNVYICVTDLQLGSRRAESRTVREQQATDNEIGSVTGVGVTQAGTITSAESGRNKTSSGSSSESVRKTFFAEKEQRLLLTAKGTRMNKAQALELMIPKLVAGVTSQIPRYRGTQRGDENSSTSSQPWLGDKPPIPLPVKGENPPIKPPDKPK